MKSTVFASVEFYYKGERYAPSAALDLDALMQAYGRLPDLMSMLARDNDIDEYSYQLEVMMMEPLHFDQAKGLAADYVNEGVLDIAAFETAWHEQQLGDIVQGIARRIMQVDDLARQPALKRALLEAYRMGKVSVTD